MYTNGRENTDDVYVYVNSLNENMRSKCETRDGHQCQN